MPGSGTRTFLEPDHYEASLRQAQIDVVITARGRFKARSTWAELHCSQVLRCEENFPHVAYVSLEPRLCFVTFATHSGPPPVWRGAEMQPNGIVLHAGAERLHLWAPGSCIWNIIALDPAQLEYYARALSGKPFSSPAQGQILRPPQRDAVRLRRVHAQICRLAETKPRILSHFEVARALEQDLIEALVTCLTAASSRREEFTKSDNASIMIRFEEVLAGRLSEPLPMPQLCERIGVTERALRTCCAEFIGMSPTRYVLSRRLRSARIALRDGDPDAVNIAELAWHFGFPQPGRFTRAYRAVFGESPSTTLESAPRARFAKR
jgi:AraC-like DNA-binding protein